MKLKDIKKSILRFLGLTVLKFIVPIVAGTYRIKLVNSEAPKRMIKEDKNIILAFWHGNMLIPWYLHKKKKFAALVSRSKDGEILTTVLKQWKYYVVRGSSHIGGKEALQLLDDMIEREYSIAITPDGPTGPPNKMKPGAVILASRKGVPLFLVGCAAANKIVLTKSWDEFEIPKPFSKIVVCYSDAIHLKRYESREEIDAHLAECEIKLNELQQKAEELVKNNS